MQVTVLGAGVVGVTTAYYLAKQGCDVTVIERQPQAGLETSFANAGQISPGYATPWAAPGVPLKALKWLFQKHAPLAIRPDGTLFQVEWLLRMLGECSAKRYVLNKERMQRVAHYSRACLEDLRLTAKIDYEGRQQGTLQVFRTQAQLDAAQSDVAVLTQLGIKHSLLTAAQIVNVEPALVDGEMGNEKAFTGALHLPGDETGDCQLFTTRLAEKCVAMGVKFRYGVAVEALVADADRLSGFVVNGTLERVQNLVVALGSFSRNLVAGLGLKIPVYPLKGYSLTIAIIDAARAPVSTVMDETYKVAVTRFNDRIRVGGMAEAAGFDYQLNSKRRATLEHVVNGLFKGAGNLHDAQFWTGLRPMTPDGTPIIGGTQFKNLWLNTGHGTLGWTMACGSGKLLSDVMTGQTPEISTDGLDASRYASLYGRSRMQKQAKPLFGLAAQR